MMIKTSIQNDYFSYIKTTKGQLLVTKVIKQGWGVARGQVGRPPHLALWVGPPILTTFVVGLHATDLSPKLPWDIGVQYRPHNSRISSNNQASSTKTSIQTHDSHPPTQARRKMLALSSDDVPCWNNPDQVWLSITVRCKPYSPMSSLLQAPSFDASPH